MIARREQLTFRILEDAPRAPITLVCLGEMEIWDGSELSLLRETLAELSQSPGGCRIAVELSYAKYLPSGLFGLLANCCEDGMEMFITTPTADMIGVRWFREFFSDYNNGLHVMKL